MQDKVMSDKRNFCAACAAELRLADGGEAACSFDRTSRQARDITLSHVRGGAKDAMTRMEARLRCKEISQRPCEKIGLIMRDASAVVPG